MCFLKKIILILIAFNFLITNSFSSIQCKDFISAISKNPEKYKTNFLPSSKFTYIDPGFEFAVFWNLESKDNNKWEFFYNDEGNLTVSKFVHSKRDKRIKIGFELISVDGIPVKSEQLYLYKLFDYFEKAYEENREVNLKFKDLNDEIVVINNRLFEYTPTSTTANLNIKSINYIDQINGKFEVFIENTLLYTFQKQDGLYLAAKDYLVTRDEKDELEEQTCNFSKEEWRLGGAVSPDLNYTFENLTQADKDQITVNYFLEPNSKESGDDEDSLKLEYNQVGNLVFYNEFNLKSFPFDRQTLRIMLYDDFYRLENRSLYSGSRTMRDLKYFVDNKKINGWNILGAETIDEVYKDPNRLNEGSAIALEIYIERKHGYYIFKVIFPIILILMVCWSVVWVDPKELEARLTITIVCLLSLIAYNFVIDSELPKLEYLTVLDWIVLISYVYATVPNFLSIISFRLQKTNLKMSNKLEQISKRYGLSSYVLSIFLIVLLNANLNPDNSSSLISWMAGR